MILFLAVSSIYSVAAQSDIEDSADKKKHLSKVLDLDNMLTPVITATLTGLSLTGGTFLVGLTRNIAEDIAAHIHIARKSFIKAFFTFLVCTISIFVFDSIEILDESNNVLLVIIDTITTYTLFGWGSLYLVRAAKHLFNTYRK